MFLFAVSYTDGVFIPSLLIVAILGAGVFLFSKIIKRFWPHKEPPYEVSRGPKNEDSKEENNV